MRPDFHKVVIERPRRGRGMAVYSKRQERRILNSSYDEDDWIDQTSINPGKYRKERKNFDDHLGPLKRYLRSQVGRKWDDVYSEISQGLPVGMHRDHILGHVDQMVETKTTMNDEGKVVGSYASRFARWRGAEVEGLYVHPMNGKLCYKQRKTKTKGRYLAWKLPNIVIKREVSVPSELEYVPISRYDSTLRYKPPLVLKEKKVEVRRTLDWKYIDRKNRQWEMIETYSLPEFVLKVPDLEDRTQDYVVFRGMKECMVRTPLTEKERQEYGLPILD